MLSEDGAVLLSRKLENTPTAIGTLIEELKGLGGSVTVGVDMTSGIAALLLAMLDAAGVRCVYVSGAAVSRARRGTRGGGQEGTRAGRRCPRSRCRAPLVVPGQTVVAEVVREVAAELLATRERIRLLDKQLVEALEQHPAALITLTLPGMGVVLTAEFHAEVGDMRRYPTGDCLAAASAMAPTIRQSGKSLWLRRPLGGNRRLKRVFYQSAICALINDPTSKTFYSRKRSEGKTHRQAVIALARRRVNVLHAMLRSRRPYDVGHAVAA